MILGDNVKKRFIAHKYRSNIIKVGLWLIIILLSFIVSFNLLLKEKVSNFFNTEANQKYIIERGLNDSNLLSLDLLNPKDILKMSLNYVLDKGNDTYSDLLLINETENDPKPLVYIYNSHQTETYDSSLMEAYNISYNVQTASYILRDYLNDYGISCYVEKASMADYLDENGLLYKDSYKASRYYITKRMEEYPSITFLIDLHRDSVSSSVTKVSIDGVDYAKVLFVVGLDHENYEQNLSLAENLNSKLDSKLSRGISKKSGSGVNGIYNQDLSVNSILLEVGGVDNNIEEVNNTLKVIAKILFEYMNGE